MANGGVLVIDDFGRQQCSAALRVEPMDRAARKPHRLPHVEERPEVRATVHDAHRVCDEYQPGELVDEAFLRRIQYKIFAESPSVQDFIKIFQNCCTEFGASANRACSNTSWTNTTGRERFRSAAAIREI